MNVDYQALKKYLSSLNNEFKNLESYLNLIKEDLNRITGSENWNSESCNYFKKECSKLFQNMENIKLKNANISTQLTQIISNYETMDNM